MLRYTLPGMSQPETRDYLTHHLKLVGRSDQLFSDDATALIHQTSRGLPRAVNNLALQALVATFAATVAADVWRGKAPSRAFGAGPWWLC